MRRSRPLLLQTSLALRAPLVIIGLALLGPDSFARPRREPPPPPTASDALTIRDRQLRIRQAVGQYATELHGDMASFNRSGRQDLVVFSSAGIDSVLAGLKAAYRSQLRLPGGFRVAGWAHLEATDSHTFTLKDEDDRSAIIEVAEDLVGTRVVIWGMGSHLTPTRRPLSALPIRLPPLR